jgi:hypothetical protein
LLFVDGGGGCWGVVGGGVASGVEEPWQAAAKTKRVAKRSNRFISGSLYQVKAA